VWNLIAQTIDFVIHIDLVRNETGDEAAVRRITSLVEVGGLGEAGGVATTEVWALNDSGRLEPRAPLSRQHLRRLATAGYDARLFSVGERA
jgi:pilus assembly protein CpaF